MKMKFSLLVFVLTSFVLNACGLLSGDPAPGRSPGPPDQPFTTLQQNSDVTTIITTTPNIHGTDPNESFALDTDASGDETQHSNRFDAESSNESNINSNNNNNRHTEHTKKPHGNAAATHHKFDKYGKIAPKIGKMNDFVIEFGQMILVYMKLY